MTWQTRTLATCIAATAPAAEDGSHPLMDYAQAIGSDPDTDPDTAAETTSQPDDPPAGSYERIMASFARRL